MDDDRLLVAVLAAGQARRFGGGKITALCAGKPLFHWALLAAERAGLAPGIIISGTGPRALALETLSPFPRWAVVPNPLAEEGLSTSIALAASHALDGGYARMLVLLGDMPLVDPEFLAELAARKTPAASLHADGRSGVPALLDRALLEQALLLEGDRGAGPLLAGAERMPAPHGSLADVDSQEDLARVSAVLNAQRPA